MELAATHSCNLFPKSLHKSEVVQLECKRWCPQAKGGAPAHQYMRNNVQPGTSTHKQKWLQVGWDSMQSLHTSFAGYFCLALVAETEASCPLYLSQAYVGSYFNQNLRPEYVIHSTAVGKALQACMEVSGQKYIFSTGDFVSRTHSLMD